MKALGLFLSTLSLFLLIIGQSFGATFLQDAVIEYDAPSGVYGKEMTTLGGGGIRIRWADQTFGLFNAVPPSLKKGCSGIDVSLGSLGLLNFDQFGRLFEALMGPAGVMFVAELALTTLCPQCEEVLSKLMSLANQLNQMQLSKCGTVAMGGALGKMLGREINNQLGGGQQDAFDKALSSITSHVNSFVNTVQNQLTTLCPGGKCGLGLMLRGGCIMDAVTNEMGNVATVFGVNTAQLGAILRHYIGDVCFPGQAGIKDELSSLPTEGVKVGGAGDINDFLWAVMGFGTNAIGSVTGPVYCMGNTEAEAIVVQASSSLNPQRTTVRISDTICFRAKELVRSMISKIENREPLSNEEKALLASMPAPVFKILNYGSVYKGFLNSIENELARYIAFEASLGLTRKILTQVSTIATAYQSGLTDSGGQKTEASEQVKAIFDKTSTLAQQLSLARNHAIKHLQEQITSYDVATQIYNSMLAQMAYSPIYGNVVFSKLIGVR